MHRHRLLLGCLYRAQRPSCNGGYEVVNYDSGYSWPCHWQSFGCCKYHPSPPPSPPGLAGDGGAVGAIIGGVVGLLVFVALIVVLVVVIMKKKNQAAAPTTVIVQQQEPSNRSEPTVAAGTPVATNAVTVEMPKVASGKKSLSQTLEELGCGQYEAALADQGYESLASLQGLTKEEAGEIADDVKMKPGHKRRFVEGIAEK